MFNRVVGFVLLTTVACNSPEVQKKKHPFVFKETIATGDTSMHVLGKLQPLNIVYDLCQQWELRDPDDANTTALTYDPKTSNHLFQEIMLYRDSSVMFNPRNGMKIGHWKLGQMEDKLLLLFNFADGTKRQYVIIQKRPTTLALVWQEGEKRYGMRLSSDGTVHANMINDPFHPSNNQWRIRPSRLETKLQLRNRIKNCIRFYALYFRDVIKRHKSEINFSGLPTCFIWYRRGIGLFKEDETPKSWDSCFYSHEQAMQGRRVVEDLFAKYEFDWPKGTPSWFYDTESVLEQMYHKMDDQ